MSDRKGLGKRQKQILERLEQGDRLFYKTFTRSSSGRRTMSFTAARRAWWGNGGGDERAESIEGLVWRKLIATKDGVEMPSVGLLSPNIKVEFELLVSEPS